MIHNSFLPLNAQSMPYLYVSHKLFISLRTLARNFPFSIILFLLAELAFWINWLSVRKLSLKECGMILGIFFFSPSKKGFEVARETLVENKCSTSIAQNIFREIFFMSERFTLLSGMKRTRQLNQIYDLMKIVFGPVCFLWIKAHCMSELFTCQSVEKMCALSAFNNRL